MQDRAAPVCATS